MRKVFGLFFLVSMILALGVVSAECAEVTDLCTWSQNSNTITLPLGSDDNSGCGLNYNTLWPVDTDTSVTCNFQGSNLADVMLYISVDNDVVRCVLTNEANPEGVEVLGYTSNTGCAPADPQSGIVQALPQVVSGDNTLVCELHDYGVMTHFDACVTGVVQETPIVPEFRTVIGVLTALGALGAFFIVRRK